VVKKKRGTGSGDVVTKGDEESPMPKQAKKRKGETAVMAVSKASKAATKGNKRQVKSE